MAEGELSRCLVYAESRWRSSEFFRRGAGFRDEMATAELRGAAGGGGRAVAGNDDADEVGGIGRSELSL